MGRISTFHFQPFSAKQLQVLTWWCKTSPVSDKNGIIADGAIRSGKTVSMALSYILWAMSTYSGMNFAMCGKTISSFRRNVLSFLPAMLQSRGYQVKYSRSDNVLVVTRVVRKTHFTFSGARTKAARI